MTDSEGKLILVIPPFTGDPLGDRISHCIEAGYSRGGGYIKRTRRPRSQLVAENCRMRGLTALECWRLMGFSDEDYRKAKSALNDRFYSGKDRSKSRLYRLAGNSIVVDVLLHIMENLRDALPELFEDVTVGSFFSGIGAFEKALTMMEEENV